MSGSTSGWPEALRLYRDDGPLARALGAALGPRVPLPGVALVALGTLPLLAAVAVAGAGASNALAVAVVAWLVLCGGTAAGARDSSRLRWLGPPLLRTGEYGSIVWLAALNGVTAVGAAFAVLAVALRHYDLVYRLRTRAGTPAPWIDAVSGGWEGRLAVVTVLLVAGLMPAGLFVLAGILFAAMAGEWAGSWRRFGSQAATTVSHDEEDETQ